MSAARIVVLISGNGSNLEALIEACDTGLIAGEITAVISSKADAYGLTRARNNDIHALSLESKGMSREEYDSKLSAMLQELQPDIIVLAGFMRILTAEFVNQFLGKLVNIHPSLLPLYPGLNTHQRAIDNGDSEHGVTVHFVTPELDAGPAILQAKVPVFDGDSAQSLSERVQFQEHRIYPMAVKWLAEKRLTFQEGVAILDGQPLGPSGFESE